MRHISSYGLTDIGLKRPHNEDAWSRDLSHHLYIVADGIGGRQAGEVASRFAAQRLCQVFTEKWDLEPAPEDLSLELLTASIALVNEELLTISQQNEFLKGMGTTLCALLLRENEAIVAHLGDSRLYRLRGFELSCLTTDHSFLISRPAKTVATRPSRCLSKALGTQKGTSPTTGFHQMQADDLFLLCSDGLTAFVTETHIQNILASTESIKTKAHQLIRSAKDSGGHDNITVLLIQVGR